MEKSETKLFIPANVRPEKEYVSGIGMTEVKYLLVSLGIAVILAVLAYLIKGDVLYSAGCMGILPVTYALVVKDRVNESFIDKVRLLIEFSRTQKNYEYEYFDIYLGQIRRDEE